MCFKGVRDYVSPQHPTLYLLAMFSFSSSLGFPILPTIYNLFMLVSLGTVYVQYVLLGVKFAKHFFYITCFGNFNDNFRILNIGDIFVSIFDEASFYSPVQSVVFPASFCRTTFMLSQVACPCARRLSSFCYHKRGFMLHDSFSTFVFVYNENLLFTYYCA